MKTDDMIKAERDKNFQPLFIRIKERIKRFGPITFCDWMEAALYEEPDGYYMRADKVRWGLLGDYRTAPETSSLFADTFASYFARLYEDMDQPQDFFIIEAGAGAGHFALGVLRSLQKQFPKVYLASRYLIDERSETSRRRSEKLLEPFGEKVSFLRLTEIDKTFPKAIVFSNELPDALPVHRVSMRDGQLKEMYVGLDLNDKFVLQELEPSSALVTNYVRKNSIKIVEGQTIEINLAAEDWLKRTASIIENGFIITVDYGAESAALYDPVTRPDGTLRAIAAHRFVDDWLSHPGEADLTSTINWTTLKQIGAENQLQTIYLESLDRFLLQAGMLDQLEIAESEAKSEIEKITLRLNARDLILQTGFGSTHQVLVQKKETESKMLK